MARSCFFSVYREQKLSLGDDSHILGFMAVRSDSRVCGVRGKQNLTVLGRQPECLERPFKSRKIVEWAWKMGHDSPRHTQVYCLYGTAIRKRQVVRIQVR